LLEATVEIDDGIIEGSEVELYDALDGFDGSSVA
jgi:hypothetical protein